MNIFGLIGKDISYSFSMDFFIRKFNKESILNTTYKIFDLPKIELVGDLFRNPMIKGLNVTIPYKISIIKFLDKISDESKNIGSVNVIKINNNNKIGYNTDIYGFEKTINKYIKNKDLKCLILGTGGVSKTVSFVLNKIGIKYKFVSRKKKNDILSYKDINNEILKEYNIIINCTPVGTYPQINNCPNIPYEYISENHILYDLIYNPSKTLFLKKGFCRGAIIKNGLEMFNIQAEQSWKIWNS